MCAFEISIVLFIVVYLFWYYKGKRDNETVAKQFLSNAYPVFSHQCTEIGDGKGHKLVRDGASDYIFYASGRSHIQYILGRLELAKRQDVMQLLSMYLWFLLDAIGLGGLLSMSAPKQDIVAFEIPFTGGSGSPVVVSMLSKSVTNNERTPRYDLTTFTKQKQISGLEMLEASTDSFEMLELFINNSKIRGKLEDVRAYLKEVTFGDAPRFKPESPEELNFENRTMYFSFALPRSNDPKYGDIIISLCELMFFSIDFFGSTRSLQNEDKLKKMRVAATEQFVKEHNDAMNLQETLWKKRMDAKKEKLSKMNAEQLRKHEEKERKREMKKRMKKGKIVM